MRISRDEQISKGLKPGFHLPFYIYNVNIHVSYVHKSFKNPSENRRTLPFSKSGRIPSFEIWTSGAIRTHLMERGFSVSAVADVSKFGTLWVPRRKT